MSWIGWLRNLLLRPESSKRGRGGARPPRSIQPMLEPLEERALLAVGLLSINRTGTDSGNQGAQFPQVSADGRFAVFQSSSSNLVSNDTNHNVPDIFVRDQLTRKTTLVSVNLAGTGSGNGNSHNPMISADGRFVVFSSEATDLVLNDSNGITTDIFVRDLVAKVTYLVSSNAAGTGSGNGESSDPSISADGRYVAFESEANDLVAHDTNGVFDVFVRDLWTQMTSLVSVNKDGTDSGNTASNHAVISGDGRHVVFLSVASDLTSVADLNSVTDVFLRDLDANTTTLLSVNKDGNAAGNQVSFIITSLNSGNYASPISFDGRFVAFESVASNLVASDTNGLRDIFVRDLQAATPELVSANHGNSDSGDSSSFDPAISADGKFVTWESLADDLVSGDGDGNDTADADVFVRNLATHTTTLVSVNSAGTGSANDLSFKPRISGDGRFVTFLSDATDLVAGFKDMNGNFQGNGRDVFVRDMIGQTTTLASPRRGTTTTTGKGGSNFPAISEDGRFVVYQSMASDLVARDTNGGIPGQSDVFIFPAPSQSVAVAFETSASSGAESVTSVQVAIILSKASLSKVSVDYAVTGGTATGGGTDYTLAGGTVVFKPGQKRKVITLSVVDDATDESDETIKVALSNPRGAKLRFTTTHTYTIRDNDP